MSSRLDVLFNGAVMAAPGAMAARVDGFDWAGTQAGRIAAWPDPLKHAARLALQSVTAMAVLIGRDGLALYNDAAAAMFGLDPDRALGRPILDALPDAALLCQGGIDAALDGRATRHIDEKLHVLRDGAMKPGWFRIAFTPIAGHDGQVCGVLMIATETTDRIRALHERRVAHKRLELAAGAAGVIGMWDFDIASGQLTIDQSIVVPDPPPDEPADGAIRAAGPRALTSDDEARIAAAIRAALRDGDSCHCQYRTPGADGTERTLAARGAPVIGADGAARTISGVIIDLTEKTAAQAALAESRMRFDTLADAVPQIVWSADAHGRHDYFNDRWRQFTGASAQDTDLHSWADLIAPQDRERVRRAWERCAQTGEAYDIEHRLRRGDGAWRWMRAMALPMRDDRGRIARWFGAFTDIHDAKTIGIERELVSRELDHRIKNLFAVVDGLVSLSVRDMPALAPAADDLHRRLRALYDAHRYLRTDPARAAPPEGATIKGLIGAVLAPYGGAGDHQAIAITGEDAPVAAGDVPAYAMIVHELATNSAKYGALADREGRLSIAVTRGENIMRLRWTETAARIAAPARESPGFGSQLLTLTVEAHLGGALVRRQTPGGLTIDMTFPHNSAAPEPRPGAPRRA